MDFNGLSNADVLEQLLNSNVDDKAVKNAIGVAKGNYNDLVKFQNVTSYSMQKELKRCPRRFQLMKMRADNESSEREESVVFAFGHAVGAGVATYDETRNMGSAIFAAFLAWNVDLLEEQETKEGRQNPKRSIHHAIWALKVYQVFVEEETDLHEYEVVQTESTVAIDFEDGHYYIGHIDETLRHMGTGRYKVKENKTTAFSTVDPALYGNSEQALSYAVVLDSVGASEYDVLYTIYSSTEQRWIKFEFTKTHLAKAEWLQSQLFLHEQIDRYSEINFFPKNGDGCIAYGRRCEHYESCDFSSRKVFGKTYAELPLCSSLEELDAIEHLDYKFTWSEIVERQKQRQGESL